MGLRSVDGAGVIADGDCSVIVSAPPPGAFRVRMSTLSDSPECHTRFLALTVLYQCMYRCNRILFSVYTRFGCFDHFGGTRPTGADGRGWEMPQVTNGMPVSGMTWRKSSYSNPSGNCVELAELAGGKIAVRNSRYPGGHAQTYPRAAMAAFVRAVKDDDFDGRAG